MFNEDEDWSDGQDEQVLRASVGRNSEQTNSGTNVKVRMIPFVRDPAHWWEAGKGLRNTVKARGPFSANLNCTSALLHWETNDIKLFIKLCNSLGTATSHFSNYEFEIKRKHVMS